MRVPQKLDYSIRALVELAHLGEDECVPVSDIADRLRLPRRFLEQQVSKLVRQGLLESHRGPHGGCQLARPADEITVAEVILRLQGSVLDVPMVTDTAVSQMWATAAKHMEEGLSRVTIDDLARRQEIIDATRCPMYYI